MYKKKKLMGLVILTLFLVFGVGKVFAAIYPIVSEDDDTTITVTVNTGTGTTLQGDFYFIYNNTTALFLNETVLNATIDGRAGAAIDSRVKGDGYFLYNDSTDMILNGTLLNLTIEGLDDVGAGASLNTSVNDIYLYNDTASIFFNETVLNNTISALDTSSSIWTNSSDTGNITYLGYPNVTGMFIGYSETDNYIYFYDSNSPIGESLHWDSAQDRFEFSDALYVDGEFTSIGNIVTSGSIRADSDIWTTGAADNIWVGSSSQATSSLVLFSNGTLYVNGTNAGMCLNNTCIDDWLDVNASAVDTDTRVKGDSYFLYNDTTDMILNETLLNLTIEGLDDVGSGVSLKGDEYFIYNDTTDIILNGTLMNLTIAAFNLTWNIFDQVVNTTSEVTFHNVTASDSFLGNLNWSYLQNRPTGLDDGDDTGAGGSALNTSVTDIYLYNDTASIFFNETVLNNTISALDNYEADTDTRVNSSTIYLYNDTVSMYFNETVLNNTISALDTSTSDTRVKGDLYFLYNDTTDMILNGTLLNLTIEAFNETWTLIDQVVNTTSEVTFHNVTASDSFLGNLNWSYLQNRPTGLDDGDDTGAGSSLNTSGLYLYNDTYTITLNETKLNMTVQNWTDANPIRLDEVLNPNTDKTFTMGASALVFSFGAPTSNALEIEGTGGFSGDLVHLHQHTGNPSNTILLSLHADDADVQPLTINAQHTYAINITSGDILLESGNVTADYFTGGINYSQINNTPASSDTDTRVKGDLYFLYNDTTDMILNETLLNLTIEGLDDVGAGSALNTSVNDIYLYNDSDSIYFNETVLNNTIEIVNETWNIFNQTLNTTSDVIFGSVNVTNDLNVTGDITLGSQLIFGLGEIIDNAVDGIIRLFASTVNIQGNLNVSTNITNQNLTIWQNSSTIIMGGGGKDICIGNC